MTYQGDFVLPTELLKQIAANGFDQLPELIRIVVNAAMQAERQQYLGAAVLATFSIRRLLLHD
jgi:putative transposase